MPDGSRPAIIKRPSMFTSAKRASATKSLSRRNRGIASRMMTRNFRKASEPTRTAINPGRCNRAARKQNTKTIVCRADEINGRLAEVLEGQPDAEAGRCAKEETNTEVAALQIPYGLRNHRR